MIFVDDILTYFRNLGHAAEYGTLEQLNEQLTSVDYSAGTDGMVAFVRLIGEQRTVNGHDQCDIAVHLSWLCPLDFSGEDLLSTQEKAKDTLKTWLQYMRDGNTVTVSTDARWQFGYDDFAENVAWVAVRVTLTASAADCVPFSPEPPTPPERYLYNYFCPQVMNGLTGKENPVYWRTTLTAYATLAVPPDSVYNLFRQFVIGHSSPVSYPSVGHGVIDETLINSLRTAIENAGEQMSEDTENWLRQRIGWKLNTYYKNNLNLHEQNDYRDWMLAWIDAMRAENKRMTFYE